MMNPILTLSLVVRWPYIAVRMTCAASRNIGAIERCHRGGGHPGTLNFTERLRVLTGTPLAAITKAQTPGQLRRGAGTGFLGWIDYVNTGAAISFLRSHTNLVFCPIAGVLLCQHGRLIPIPLPHGNGCNYWTALIGAIEQAIRNGLAPRRIVFRRGGLPIPDDFIKWCAEHGIQIDICEPCECDNQYPLPDLSTDFGALPPWVDEEGNPFF